MKYYNYHETLVALRNEIYNLNKDEIATDLLINEFIRTKKYDHEFCETIEPWLSCKECPLNRTRNFIIPFMGSFSPRLVIVGEAPGPEEDEKGGIFIGKSGQYLRSVLTKCSINVFSDVLFVNSVSCIPKDTKNSHFRAPIESEIKTCFENNLEPYILNDSIMDLSNLEVVMFLGANALKIKDLISTSSDSKKLTENLGWNSSNIADKNINTYVTYHPSYILRINDRDKTQEWVNDIKVVSKFLLTKEKTDWRK